MNLLGICGVAIDNISRVDHLPIEDSFCTILSQEKKLGGSGANVLVQFSTLGGNAAQIANLASDNDSQIILKNLQDA